jgi:ribosomal 50S subunit-recycling heat shock protein
MRLDIYIAQTRVLKSRSLVKDAMDAGMVYLNGHKAKPAATVNLGDIIEIDTPRFYKKIRAAAYPTKNMKKAEAAVLFEPLEERKKELI